MKRLPFILILSLTVILLGACTAKGTFTPMPDETEVALSQATATTIVPISLQPQVDNCVVCHTDKQMLIDTTATVKEDAHGAESQGVSWGGAVAPLEPWEKVMIGDKFFTDVHGSTTCSACHAGDSSTLDKEAAHADMIPAPDADPERTCGNCHNEIVSTSADSLHVSQAGFFQALYSRSIPEKHLELDEMFGNHCQSCHTTCGDCHISQPDSVGGGLLDGHTYVKTPPMTSTCTACHGSRVGNEFMGGNKGVPGDVHFRQGGMSCVDCHDGASMHDSEGNNHRYEGAQSPTCESCHDQVGKATDTIVQHQIHHDTLSCQVCHSVTYTSCDGCHVAINESTGNPFFKTASTYSTFFIGRNTRKNSERPYDYVPVRHIPVTPDSFEYYGENLLPNFNLLPSWAYATPHNIQRNTPQNETCNSCHGNAEIFLTVDKVKPEELEANLDVIVENIPVLIP